MQQTIQVCSIPVFVYYILEPHAKLVTEYCIVSVLYTSTEHMVIGYKVVGTLLGAKQGTNNLIAYAHIVSSIISYGVCTNSKGVQSQAKL